MSKRRESDRKTSLHVHTASIQNPVSPASRTHFIINHADASSRACLSFFCLASTSGHSSSLARTQLFAFLPVSSLPFLRNSCVKGFLLAFQKNSGSSFCFSQRDGLEGIQLNHPPSTFSSGTWIRRRGRRKLVGFGILGEAFFENTIMYVRIHSLSYSDSHFFNVPPFRNFFSPEPYPNTTGLEEVMGSERREFFNRPMFSESPRNPLQFLEMLDCGRRRKKKKKNFPGFVLRSKSEFSFSLMNRVP